MKKVLVILALMHLDCCFALKLVNEPTAGTLFNGNDMSSQSKHHMFSALKNIGVDVSL